MPEFSDGARNHARMNSACKYGSNTYDRNMSRVFITLFIIHTRTATREGFNRNLIETKRLNYKRWYGESPRLFVSESRRVLGADAFSTVISC